METIDVVLRTSAIYLFIILAIRLFGKKELSQLSVIDLVFILLISNAVQNSMVGQNTSLLGGIAAASSLFVMNFLLKNVIFRSKRMEHFIQGSPIMLVYEGKIIKEHLKHAEISMDELEAAIREHGVSSIEDVNLAVMEVDGNISILSNEYKHKSVKRRKSRTYLAHTS